MTTEDKHLWTRYAATLRDDVASLAEAEKRAAELRRDIAETRLRMKCLEQGIRVEDIPK